LKKEGFLLEEEIFKELFLYGRTYSISSFGRVFSNGVEISQRLNVDGYPVVTVGKTKTRRMQRVHRLVAVCFCSREDTSLNEINHLDFDRTNNNYNNLEWTTHRKNIEHSQKNNPNFSDNRQGELNGNSKLKELDVKDIFAEYSEGKSIASIARKHNCGWTTISHVLKRETWKNV